MLGLTHLTDAGYISIAYNPSLACDADDILSRLETDSQVTVCGNDPESGCGEAACDSQWESEAW